MEDSIRPDNPLDFTDIYICMSDIYKSDVFYSGIDERVSVCEELIPHVNNLLGIITKQLAADKDGDSFSLEYNGKYYRCQFIDGVNGLIADLRVQPRDIIQLKNISIPLRVKQVCTSGRLNKGGLILVSGGPGQGKTTTCAAILVERLQRYGGFCLAIENPIDLPLDGVHGKGRLVQVEIKDKSEYKDVGRMSMRCYPTDKPCLMFISEIRDSESAALALSASLDGRLVVATIHADTPISALKRIIHYASFLMDEGDARQLLYNGFRLCLHQERSGSEIKSTVLVDTPSVVPLIRNGKLDMLGTEIDFQQRLISENMPIKTRDV